MDNNNDAESINVLVVKKEELATIKRVSCRNKCGSSFETLEDAKLNANIDCDEMSEFTCKICKKSYVHEVNLKKHELKHMLDKDYTCVLCLSTYLNKEELSKHIADKHKSNNKNTNSKKKNTNQKYACALCESTFPSEKKLTKHMADNHETIDEKSNLKSKQIQEVETNAETTRKKNELFVCTDCGTQFQTNAQLRRHNKNKCKDISLNCDQCGSKFPTQSKLNNHVLIHVDDTAKKQHDQVEVEEFSKKNGFYVCTDCGAQYHTAAQLKRHNSSKCGKEKSFSCGQCGSKFITQNTLKAHLLIHVGEKPHLCGYCGNSFLSKGQLKVHERSHTGERPFKCDVCGKSFSYRESLVTHSSIHTGIKPYLCEGCSSRFSCIGNLIKHRRSRPDSCGLPQFCKNTKIAPRASAKGNAKKTTVPPANQTSSSPPTPPPPEEMVFPFKSTNSSNSLTANKKENQNEDSSCNELCQKLEDSEEIAAIINDLTDLPLSNITQQTSQPVFLSTTESMEIVSNVEIEYTTSDYINTNNNQIVDTVDDRELNEDDEDDFDTDQFEITYIPGLEHPTVVNDEYVEVWQNEDVVYQNVDGQTCYYDEQEIEISYVKDELNVFNDGTEVSLPDNVAEDSMDNLPLATLKSQQEYHAFNESAQMTVDLENTDHVHDENKIDVFDNIILNDVKATDMVQVVQLGNSCKEWYKCPLCPSQYIQERLFLKHMAQMHHTKIQPKPKKSRNPRNARKSEFKCNVCGKKYLSQTVLKKHITEHGKYGTLTHKCSCCRKWFATSEDVDKHGKLHHKDKLFCQPCNRWFNEQDNYTAHIRYSHSFKNNASTSPAKRYIYVCSKCGRECSSRMALSDHERASCGNDPIYKCLECNKCFHSAGSLKTHQTVHTGDLPHLCKYCGKAFRTQGQVKVHERKHNGEKPFKCEFCPKSFGYRESLLTHVSLHTGIKRFMCQPCGGRFSCISNLQAHRKSHADSCGLFPNVTKAFITQIAS